VFTKTPHRLTAPIQALIERLVPGGRAEYVAVEARPGAIVNDCYANVDAQVAELGGSAVHGWAIWEWPCTMLEAEFHAVWRQPDGRHRDVTARTDYETRVLFLPDPVRAFSGRQINNVRVPLRDDPLVHEWIGLHDAKFEVLNRGDRINQFGAVAVDRAEIESLLLRMMQVGPQLEAAMPARSGACCCGSGKKFKRCCGATA
jgi:hypothetical protein